MSELNRTYGDDSIDQLLGAERIRKRPATMLGADDINGARHGFTEIYGNALDEASTGYGDKLCVKYHADHSVSIRDFGRGVPLGWNERRKTWNWHIIYNDLYGGGKYETNQDKLASITDWGTFNDKDYNYLYSVGLNGLGAASTQYTSEFFNVESYRDGECTRMEFRKGLAVINGEPVDLFREQYDMSTFIPNVTKTDEPNGTLIHWKPDSDVFSEVDMGADWLFDTCKDIANVAGITLHFENEVTGEVIVVEAGDLPTLIKTKHNDKLEVNELDEPVVYTASEFAHGTSTDNGKTAIYVCKVDVAIGVLKDGVNLGIESNNGHECFHNSVKMKGGIQYYAVSAAIQDFFTEKARLRGVRLEYTDYDNVFAIAVSSYSNIANFRNQTKDEIASDFVFDPVRDAILNKLNMEYNKGNAVVTETVERVLREAQGRIAIKELSKQVREANKNVKVSKTPQKFVTCKSYIKKDYENSELWIVEGDSACGAIKFARDSDFQAIYPVRGKCINALKKATGTVVKDSVVGDIFSVLGTGMDIGHKNMFDLSKVRFGKIIFATDADEDGFQIRVLLFLICYVLAPQLITDGRVYIAETPRFQIRLSNGEELYAKDDIERDKIKAEYGGQITSINRFKGLGEVDADILRKTTIHPDTRNLVPITLDFQDKAIKDLIDALFGADREHKRKELLTLALGEHVAEMLENSHMVLEDIEGTEYEDDTETIKVEA